ncbi:hypothetical protein AHF37_11335 [Paragonimus kellicotti]|nr:hypothetical protein AHF37_11335 [Paragonimus kellicotti]
MDAEGLMQLSKHPDFINYLEESASHWMRQIDEEAKEIELLRVEREQNGPHGEFDFWKCRMTRMNSLVSELRRTDIQNVILALQSVRSKAMEVINTCAIIVLILICLTLVVISLKMIE